MRPETTGVEGAERSRNRGLDSIRAIAAVLVLLVHLQDRGLITGPLALIAGGGRVGVIAFFILSGFVLARPPTSLGGFWANRLARIVPAYWVALVVLAAVTRDPRPASHPLEYALLVQNYDPALYQGFLGPSWTLGVELVFYALVPLLTRLASRWLVAFLVASLGLELGLEIADVSGPVSISFPVFAWAFCLGILLFRSQPRIRHRLGVVAGLALLAVSLVFRFWIADVFAASGAACLVVAAANGWQGIGSWAGRRLSYPFYLWHKDLLRLGGWAGVPITVGVAIASAYLVEAPARATVAQTLVRARRARGQAISTPTPP